MATQPTNMPVPSESPRDLKFNAGKIDEFVTSQGWTYIDRFGGKHYTIEGINYLAQQVMNAFGYVTLTGLTFTTGATVENPNEVLFNTADNAYYKWTGSFSSGPKVVPANSTPESTGGIGPGKWLSVGDTVLRSDLASHVDGFGDEMLGVQMPYDGGAPTTQHEVNKRLVNILDFLNAPGVPASGDGVTDNAVALQKASSAVGDGGVIYFPKLGGTNYLLGAATQASWTDNRILKTDDGVIITVPDSGYISNTAKFDSLVKLHYASINSNFYYPKSTGREYGDRPVWVSDSERDTSILVPANPAAGDFTFRRYSSGSDTSTAASATATSATGYVVSETSSTSQTCGMVALNDKEELSAYFDSPTSSTTTFCVVMIECTAGRIWYNNIASNTATPVKNIRSGGSVTTANLSYQGMSNQPGYVFYNGDIAVRRETSQHFSLLVNGFTADSVDVSSLGEIIRVGFGVTSSATGNITVSRPSIRRLGDTGQIGTYLHICIFGDSITAEALGASWPKALKALDANNGTRLVTVDNYAHAGDDSAAQRSVMDGVSLGNYNTTLMMIGVNDIQGGVQGDVYLANMEYMINKAVNSGHKVVVACPSMFYGQAQSGGGGQDTHRADQGKYHRAGIRRMCADKGVKFIETNQIIGPVFSDFITDPALRSKDSTVGDNIHPTPNTNYLMARAFYNALRGVYSPATSMNMRPKPMQGTAGASVTPGTGSDTPTWSRDSDGNIYLSGILNWTGGSAPANGTVFYTLQPSARPTKSLRLVGQYDGGICRIIVDTSGDISVFGMTSGTWVALDTLAFKGVV